MVFFWIIKGFYFLFLRVFCFEMGSVRRRRGNKRKKREDVCVPFFSANSENAPNPPHASPLALGFYSSLYSRGIK